ncbi:conjugal transfer protein TrbH [Legionella pneumophila]|uniref:conjugal transfer protein TrbH n=1 Tax=Legionella pneumophila TaxID=446 RepID=UPI00077091FC|nr:conjugal transfer protein TrbH [Legionella pneumophila]CZP19175.1 conjugal transfer protein TrbH [Legionella pneumophila]CZP47719.1 conjugal transfer protein TrbH [Legionella pneumophila]HAT4435241.1 conjugal transfer protein TrbH [Legionella pneumophila]HAT8603961.1 conjugal transfer protein TrbH [Legionella pneumophila]HAU0130302.1 conjugal transfer protein TrbH [Legionella pneumophila]
MKKLSVLLLTILLSSCASMRYGNFTESSQNKDIYLAKDAISQLTRVYPPARNTFCISQKICDGFGIKLIQEMRKKGYGVVENVYPRNKANFFYVVDETEPGRLYRVSLYIGPQTLSRVYAKTNGKLTPISPWSHKE